MSFLENLFRRVRQVRTVEREVEFKCWACRRVSRKVTVQVPKGRECEVDAQCQNDRCGAICAVTVPATAE